jgi:hypothetical protein
MALPTAQPAELHYAITSAERAQRERARLRKAMAVGLPSFAVGLLFIVLASGGEFMGTIIVTGVVIVIVIVAIALRPAADVQVNLSGDGIAVMRRGAQTFHPWSAFCSFTDIATFVEHFGSGRNRQAEITGAKLAQQAHGNVFKLFYANPKWYSANIAYTVYAEPENAAQVQQFILKFLPAYDPKNPATLSAQQQKLQMYVAIISALFLALAITIFAYLKLTQY